MAKKKQRSGTARPATGAVNRPRPEQTGPKKSQLIREAQQKTKRRAKLRRQLTIGGTTLVVVAVVAAYVLISQRKDADLRSALTSGTCTVDTSADRTDAPPANHVTVGNPSYTVNPPAGGDHLTSNALAGVYAGTTVPVDGLLVHSLEHGYVILWHQPGLAADKVAELQAFQKEHPADVIVAERASLPVPVAATAWGQRLLCQQVETVPLTRFFNAHVGNGPEDVARG